MRLKVNGQIHEFDAPDDIRLLWVLRDLLGLKGTRFGCGVAACGACTVLIDGQPMRSCIVRAANVSGDITTIEGLSGDGELHPVQQAWIEEQVPQCGYCQSGQILAAVALLENKPNPNDVEIGEAMTNLCRCGTYPRIRAAIKRVAAIPMLEGVGDEDSA